MHDGNRVGKSSRVQLIVPLFNEALRWNTSYWQQIVEIPDLELTFVNDGSSDATHEKIRKFAECHPCTVIDLPSNVGKANAVRIGLQAALDSAAGGVGFMDGDGAFAVGDIKLMVEEFRARASDARNELTPVVDAVWSSRVALAGRDIRRRSSRHYLGRVIATMISPGIPNVPYDTQSGFKLFRPSQTLGECLDQPFRTRWFMDVELLQRWWQITGQPMNVWEVPLMSWEDVPGSKLNARDLPAVTYEIALIVIQTRNVKRRQLRGD